MRQIKIIVEKHPDGYVAYPLGIKGVVVGEGDTYEEALADVKSAIHCHIEIFGQDILEDDNDIEEREWLKAAASNPVFDFLRNPEEDIYTINDGKPFNSDKVGK